MAQEEVLAEIRNQMMKCTTFVELAKWCLLGHVPLGKFEKLQTVEDCQAVIKKWMTEFIKLSNQENKLLGLGVAPDNTYTKFMKQNPSWAKLMKLKKPIEKIDAPF